VDTSHKLTLGRALAHLKSQNQSGKNNYGSLPEQDINYINNLHKRAQELKTLKTDEIFQDTFGIKDQTDFFLHLFLCEDGEIDCSKMLSTLNNNSGLLDELSVILSDFIEQKNNLKKGKI